jgi:hypothetical protein
MWLFFDKIYNHKPLKKDPAPHSTTWKIKGKLRHTSFHEAGGRGG